MALSQSGFSLIWIISKSSGPHLIRLLSCWFANNTILKLKIKYYKIELKQLLNLVSKVWLKWHPTGSPISYCAKVFDYITIKCWLEISTKCIRLFPRCGHLWKCKANFSMSNGLRDMIIFLQYIQLFSL